MTPRTIPAVFMRGGTSKALMFHARDLPADRPYWDRIFLGALGSPDPNGRQLDGMGGGLSSFSKVCVIAPSARADADVEYTFAQISLREAHVDYSGNCGNMLSAVGPFAIDEGLVSARGNQATVRIFNTNTRKIVHSTFAVEGGYACYSGDFRIPGVAGCGSPIRLDFIEPGGATTGRLLPTGHTKDQIEVPGLGKLEVSMVDAANACVFVRAVDIGLDGNELPDALEHATSVLETLQSVRIKASVAMGVTQAKAQCASSAIPYVGFVSKSAKSSSLSAATIAENEMDLTVRFISNGQPHRALPLTASLCTAVAARIDGTIVQEMVRPSVNGHGLIRLGMPSGVLTLGADVEAAATGWHARRGTFYRTARRLFDGRVYLPARLECSKH